MPTAYTIAPAPRYSSMMEHDCALCGHETLARPIFLAGPSGVIAAGSGCAAKALYGDQARTTRVRREFDAVTYAARQAEELAAERQSRYAAALVDLRLDQDATPALQSARQTYHRSGGYRGLWMTFPAFLALVASTGQIPQPLG